MMCILCGVYEDTCVKLRIVREDSAVYYLPLCSKCYLPVVKLIKNIPDVTPAGKVKEILNRGRR